MLFNSIPFLIFAPLFFITYFLLRGQARLIFVAGASYFFYAWWDARFCGLLLLSSVVDFWIGHFLARPDMADRQRKMWLMLSLAVNLGMLGIFKYFDFFAQSFTAVLNAVGIEATPLLLNVVLPVGISFYTFQTLSYSIDLYRRTITEPETSFIRFAAYVALFPQLVAGPIVRAAALLPQLREDHGVDWARIGRGIELIAWGFFLKLCLADTASLVVDPRYAKPEFYNALSHLIGSFAFSFQIYGDFAGYSLIAIGLGAIMGLDFGINFNRPYFATSFGDFWTRWHISLSRWIRDYIYISLGGNRGGELRTFRNLCITMFLGGLWHGAGWNFVVWGLLHGFYQVLQRIFGPPFWRIVGFLRLPRMVSLGLLMLTVFLLTTFAWIFFRADNFDQAWTIIGIIASGEGWTLGAGEQLIAIAKMSVFAVIVIVVDALGLHQRARQYYLDRLPLRIAGLAALGWLIALGGTFSGASFIYFQF